MPEPLKNEFSEILVRKLGKALASKEQSFDENGFHTAIINISWEARELKDRMHHITKIIHAHSRLDYLRQLKTMVSVSDQFGSLFGMIFPDYVEQYGLDYLDESLDALEHMTRFSSSEFAIRPFIVKNEKQVMGRMLKWSRDKNEHVRRLASEGCRPRLPWAMALPSFKNDPTAILPILENLKCDESLYVRKSVANNLNDLTKDNPDVVLDLASAWYGKADFTDWIVKHGLRTLLKNGNKKALEIIGFNEGAKFQVTNLKLSAPTVELGGNLNFDFQISNLEPDLVSAKVGFVVAYMKSNGKYSDKIFHIAEKEFVPGKRVLFKKKLDFKNLTTRKHYPGVHKLSIVVNGKKLSEKSFNLI